MVLLTNDDGIDAPGLAALTSLAEARYGVENVWVVAPAAENSQIGHRVTTGEILKIDRLAPQRIAVHGTPADCTRLALNQLLPGTPDLVISGINFGGNLGRHDFVISGTVAAAREAAFHGIESIAVSNFHRSGVDFSWKTSAEMTAAALDFIGGEKETHPGEFWVVNLPHLNADEPEPPKIKMAHQENEPLELAFEPLEGNPDSFRYTGRYHERPASGGSDVAICFGGNIAVSRVWI
ncbi:UNVERIFIED_CONTAM: hypothetical protein GTU68_004541 [Idotea baltica]|nr:hypothetical protein [Idotea baltica]